MSILNQNDGIFRSEIPGIISGKTSQVVGVNAILSNLLNNTNYLKDTKADKTVKVVAGKGLTGGGSLAGNVPLDIVSANSGITITEDGVQLMTVDSISSTDKVRPASANAVKLAYDNANGRVSKSGDTMTGQLIVPSVKTVGIKNQNDKNAFRVGGVGGNATILGAEGVDNSETYLCASDNKKFIARVTNSSGIQGEYEIYHKGNRPTPSEIGSYTKGESDSRFINNTGDTMSGNLLINSASPTMLNLKRNSGNLNVCIGFGNDNKIKRYFGYEANSNTFKFGDSESLDGSDEIILTETRINTFKNRSIFEGFLYLPNGNKFIRHSGNGVLLGAETPSSGTVPDALTILQGGNNGNVKVRVNMKDYQIYNGFNRPRSSYTHLGTFDNLTKTKYKMSIKDYDFIYIKYDMDNPTTASNTYAGAVTVPSTYRGITPLITFDYQNARQYIFFKLHDDGLEITELNDDTNGMIVFGVKIG